MPSERRSTGEWDAVVCGGGTGGAVVAAELVRSGRRVLLLEAGPDYGPYADGGWPHEMVDSAKCPETHDWGYRSGDDLPGRELLYERARVIGGCSAHNGCTVCWGTRADYDAWGIPGWSADRLQPLFERCSREMRVRRFADEELTPLHRGFIEAGLGLGLPAVDDLDTLDGVPGAGAQPSNSPDGVRWNTAFAFLDPVRGRPELEIRDRCLVDRRWSSAVVRSACTRSPAGRRSRRGLTWWCWPRACTGPRACSCARASVRPTSWAGMGIDVLVENRGVGANLHDHPGFELILPGNRRAEAAHGCLRRIWTAGADEQSFVKAASSACEGAAFDLHLFAVPEDPKRGLHIYVANVDPRSRGTVSKTERSASGHLLNCYLESLFRRAAQTARRFTVPALSTLTR